MRVNPSVLGPRIVEVRAAGAYLGLCLDRDLPDLRRLERALRGSADVCSALKHAMALDGPDHAAGVAAATDWLRRRRGEGFGGHLFLDPGRPEAAALRWSSVAWALVDALCGKPEYSEGAD